MFSKQIQDEIRKKYNKDDKQFFMKKTAEAECLLEIKMTDVLQTIISDSIDEFYEKQQKIWFKLSKNEFSKSLNIVATTNQSQLIMQINLLDRDNWFTIDGYSIPYMEGPRQTYLAQKDYHKLGWLTSLYGGRTVSSFEEYWRTPINGKHEITFLKDVILQRYKKWELVNLKAVIQQVVSDVLR